MSSYVQDTVIFLIGIKMGLSLDEIQLEQEIVDDLGADSLDVIELILDAEDEFEIEISDDEAERVRTVQDAVNLIHRLTLA